MVFLITASFFKFLFESEAVSESPDIRKKRIIEILKTGKENDFEDTFKKLTGLKIKKAEKLWKKDLKIKSRI
jgi:oligoendopeptidase F